jgi:hypothetical protein
MEESDDLVLLPQCALYLKSVPGKGRGVYVGEDLPSGRLIHVSPMLLFASPQTSRDEGEEKGEDKQVKSDRRGDGGPCCVEKDVLAHYTYTWDHQTQALALGLGSMFNHSKHPNIGFVINKEKVIVSYTTLRDIRSHEELCISYGNKLWFEDLERYSESSDGNETEDFLLKGFNLDNP